MGALVDHADAQEEGPGDDPVVDHLKDRALDAVSVERKDAQRHEAHVADARVGDEALDIRLGQGHVRAVDDGDDREHQHGREEELRGIGEDRQRDPQEPVGAHLEENPGQDHAPCGGRLGVGIRQPGVHGEHGHLDRERRQKGDEEPCLQREARASSPASAWKSSVPLA